MCVEEAAKRQGAAQCNVNVDVAKQRCQGDDPSTAVIGYFPAARVKMAVINSAAV